MLPSGGLLDLKHQVNSFVLLFVLHVQKSLMLFFSLIIMKLQCFVVILFVSCYVYTCLRPYVDYIVYLFDMMTR